MSWAGTDYLPSGVDINDPRLSPLRVRLRTFPDCRPPISTPQVSTYCATRGKHMPMAMERAGVNV